jgi:very-short-patch-repair endonuclease
MIKTLEEFLENLKEVSGDDYTNFDFSNSKFNGLTKNIQYVCNIHKKTVNKSPKEVLKGFYGCGICSKEKTKKTKNEKSKKKFFEEAPKLHNNYYTYNEDEFVDMTTPITINCPNHDAFKQKPIKHLNCGQGCNKCGDERAHDKQRMTKDEVIRRSIEKHGDEHYGYNLDNYLNCDTNIEIYCNICNKSFQQTPYHHIHGSGCTDCGIIKRANEMKRIASERFWKKANNDERFDFSKYVYSKAITKSDITCKQCDEKFSSSPNNYLCGKGCPFCRKKTEKKLNKELKKIYPDLKRELEVDWCRNHEKRNGKHHYFRYDFYIEDGDRKILIELDGIQHIKPQKFFDRKMTFEERHERDVYKQKCANENGYHTIRILQEDVFYDKNLWFSNLKIEIEYIKNNQGSIHHRYICDNNEYDIFM